MNNDIEKTEDDFKVVPLAGLKPMNTELVYSPEPVVDEMANLSEEQFKKLNDMITKDKNAANYDPEKDKYKRSKFHHDESMYLKRIIIFMYEENLKNISRLGLPQAMKIRKRKEFIKETTEKFGQFIDPEDFQYI